MSCMMNLSATCTPGPSRNNRRLLGGLILLLLALPVVVVHLVTVGAIDEGHAEADTEPDGGLTLTVDPAHKGRLIPPTLFGIFFEEINHAGAGGIWAELVSNRGNRNPVALRLDVLCNSVGSNPCPEGGVGTANPGFWGMDISAPNEYKVVLWLLSKGAVNLSVAFTSSDGLQILAQQYLIVDSVSASRWSRQELTLQATATDHQARLLLLSRDKGTIWLDQISAMPVDTYKGHGFRKQLATMLSDLNPAFLRFPGGCYVEGGRLANAWRWKETVGPWEERPGHLGDVWDYWSDDGLGYFEYLQLAEDLGALPVWVFNNGISHSDEIATSLIAPFIKDTLNGIEFARGDVTTEWGSLREKMGHPDPFPLRYIAIGNEDCGKLNYVGNYLEFYAAIKRDYPDIKLISNCDATLGPLDHPADLYDFHIYTTATNLFAMSHEFDYVSRVGPKVFVSEYAVVGSDSGTGSLLAALGEAAFMIGMELNSDVVEMASYAPLFVNENDRRWNPDAIVFNSWQQYGTPSYWVQKLFQHSNGATLLPFYLEADTSTSTSAIAASALRRHDVTEQSDFLVIKIVNFGADLLTLHLEVEGLDGLSAKSSMTVLSSENVMDENSFNHPQKVVPKRSVLSNPSTEMQVLLPGHSIVCLDLQIAGVLRAEM